MPRTTRSIVIAVVILLTAGCGTGLPQAATTASTTTASTGTVDGPDGDAPAGKRAGQATGEVPSTTAAAPMAVTAAAVLESLVVAVEVVDGTYDRALYDHWSTQPTGCSARVEVLIAESTSAPQVDRYGSCAVVAGDWWSAYDDVTVSDAAELDVDHVVALAEAHRSGAYAWDATRREAFANDVGHPDSLVAVTAGSNRAKSDHDPADWLPPNDADTCRYLAAWIGVKARWRLTVDTRERDAIASRLAACPGDPGDAPLPTTPDPSTIPPAVPPPAQPSTTMPAPDGPVYGSCAAVRAAGAAPIRHGEPGFHTSLDGDGDGIGCE